MPFRRPLPTIVCTAITATAVVLPWALDGGTDRPAAPAATAELAEQPLADVGAGVTVREVGQDTPFSMVALTGEAIEGTEARVRAQRADGRWGPWYETEAAESGATAGRRGTEPVYVGRTTRVQIEVNRPAGAPATPPPRTAAPEPDLGYRPANVEHPLPQNISAVLISPPRAPVDTQWTPQTAVVEPGQPPAVIGRAQWGAVEENRCGGPHYDAGVRAAVVHHTAESNDYAPQDSAGIVQSIYAYHTRTLGWCDIAYNALVDKYGQVFEGRAGGLNKPVEGSHTGGFNRDTWGVAMIGDFSAVPPTPIQVRTVGRLLGWRLSLSGVNPLGSTTLVSDGGSYTHFARGTDPTLPTIFTHRDVGITECPGNAGYAAMDDIRAIAARFNLPPGPEELAEAMRGGAIHTRWQQLGGRDSALGVPTSPEAAGEGLARYANFEHGAVYWSPDTGAQPLTGAIYEAWAALGYERGALGLPTSGEIQEPLWIGQNFQHGTLNFDRLDGTVSRVIDGVAVELPPPAPEGPPVQVERFTPIT